MPRTIPESCEAMSRQLQMSAYVLKANVGDVTHEESLRTFPPADNPLYWILAHLVATRSHFLRAFGGTPVWSAEECRRFDRHAPPLHAATVAPLRELWQAFDLTQERLIEALGRLTAEDLARPAPKELQDGSVKTVGDALVVAGFHDAYHAGQTGVMRRLLGRAPRDL